MKIKEILNGSITLHSPSKNGISTLNGKNYGKKKVSHGGMIRKNGFNLGNLMSILKKTNGVSFGKRILMNGEPSRRIFLTCKMDTGRSNGRSLMKYKIVIDCCLWIEYIMNYDIILLNKRIYDHINIYS